MVPGFRCAPSGLRRFWLPARWSKLKPLEAESWSDCAANERPVAERFRRLPGICWHGGLRPLAIREVGSEADRFDGCSILRDAQSERRAGVEMPDLNGINAVPVRALAALQQKVDGGRTGAAVGTGLVAKGLAKMPTLGMRRKPEQADDLLR